MRSRHVLFGLFATCTIASRTDRYTFVFYDAFDCAGSSSCFSCGSKGCPVGTECGTWGGEADSCCQAVNFSVENPLCSPFTSILENFDFSKDGIAPTGPINAGETCPNIETNMSLRNYLKTGQSGCCPLTTNFVTKKDISMDAYVEARCIPDPTAGAAASQSGAASETMGSTSAPVQTESAMTSMMEIASSVSSPSSAASASITQSGSATVASGGAASSTTTKPSNAARISDFKGWKFVIGSAIAIGFLQAFF